MPDWKNMTTEQRLNWNCTKSSGCWIWKGSKHAYGYGILRRSKSNLTELAHRAAYRTWVGPIPNGLFVLHSCDVFACINPKHLHLGTTQDNTREAVERGRMAAGDRNGSRKFPERMRRGEANPAAKIKESDVLTIRELRKKDWKLVEIADCFGITFQAVSKILRGDRWKHVNG